MRRLDSFQDQSDTVLFVGPNSVLSQSFRSLHQNLAGIRLPIYNPRLGGQAAYQISILNPEHQIIRQMVIKESNLGWGEDFRFDFSPIAGSLNQTYTFSVSFSDTDQTDSDALTVINRQQLGQTIDSELPGLNLESVKENYISLPYSRENVYFAGKASLNDLPLSGDLAFQVYYSVPPLTYLEDSLLDLISRISQDLSFFVFYFIFLIGLVLILIKRLHKAQPKV